MEDEIKPTTVEVLTISDRDHKQGCEDMKLDFDDIDRSWSSSDT